MEWPADLFAASLIGASFVLLVFIAEVWTRYARPDPEWPRKIVHILGGVICLFFPFCLESSWTVLILGSGLFLLITIGKQYRFLHSLHGIERQSKGAEYYPLMIFALFWLAHETPWLYAASLLALAMADAMAALVGTRWGRARYQVDEEWKTVEGSLTFFVVAWIVIAIPLLLSDSGSLPGGTHRIMVAGVAAILVTMLEAISRHGRDNIWIPLGTFLVLSRLIGESIDHAMLQLISIVCLCFIVAVYAIISGTINVGASLTLILAIYTSWALTSFDFALPLMSGTILCMSVAYYHRPEQKLRAAAVTHMLLPVVLAAAAAEVSHLSGRQDLYQLLFAALIGGCAVVAMQNVWEGVLKRGQRSSIEEHIRAVLISAVVACVLSVPLWLRGVGITASWVALLFGIAVVAYSFHGRAFAGNPPSSQQRQMVLRRYLTIVAGMAVCATAQFLQLLPTLTPR